MADPAIAATWLSSLSTMGMIFGGCCSNVFALEAIIKTESDSGFLITFTQFLIAVLASLPTQLSHTDISTRDPKSRPARALPGLRSPKVPLSRWALMATMFFACNMLNNWAFAFDISVPIHIILRSFGSVSTMAAGWTRGKRYSRLQVGSVILLTVGVLISARADAQSKGRLVDQENSDPTGGGQNSAGGSLVIGPGLAILLVAQILAAFMGICVQEANTDYGCDWTENMFYTHALALPLFLPMNGTLRRQYGRIAAGDSLGRSSNRQSGGSSATTILSSLLGGSTGLSLSEAQIYLVLNAATQLVCITGVNILAAKSSAVTVTIVLNVRKLVSFVLSTILFGHSLSFMTKVGAAIVFGSGALYGWESSWRIPRRRRREQQSRATTKVQR